MSRTHKAVTIRAKKVRRAANQCAFCHRKVNRKALIGALCRDCEQMRLCLNQTECDPFAPSPLELSRGSVFDLLEGSDFEERAWRDCLAADDGIPEDVRREYGGFFRCSDHDRDLLALGQSQLETMQEFRIAAANDGETDMKKAPRV